MVAKSIFFALTTLILFQGVQAVPADDSSSLGEVSMSISLDFKDDSDKTIEATPESFEPNESDDQKEKEVTSTLSYVVESISMTIPPASMTGGLVVDEYKAVCLNICAHAAFLAGSDKKPCDPNIDESFYNYAQVCSVCACDIWPIFDDKEDFIKGLGKCKLPVPKCSSKESDLVSKRHVHIDKRNVIYDHFASKLSALHNIKTSIVNQIINGGCGGNCGNCQVKKTVTGRRTRPPIPRGCIAGCRVRTVIYPRTQLPASRRYGQVVTYYPPVVWPRVVITRKGCQPVRTQTIRPTRQKVDVKPTCRPGTKAGVVKFPQKVVAATRVTRGCMVTVRLGATFPASVTTIKACQTRRTVTVTPPKPNVKSTCAAGHQSKRVWIKPYTYTRRTTVGANGVVTVSLAKTYTGYYITRKPCQTRRTVTVTPPKPNVKSTCAAGHQTKKVWVKPYTYTRRTTVGANGVVTVSLAKTYPGYYITRKPCQAMKTITVTPPQPNVKSTCAPGYQSKKEWVKPYTYTRRTTVGANGVVTVSLAKTYTGYYITRKPCTISDPGVNTSKPPANPEPSSQSPGQSKSKSKSSDKPDGPKPTSSDGPDGPEPTTHRSTITVTYDPPTPTESCVEGTNSKRVTIPGTEYPDKTETGEDDTVTIRPSVSFPPSTPMIPGCTPPGGDPSNPGHPGQPGTGTSSCPGAVCTCTPKPPVCVTYDVIKAFYCGEWILYKKCSTYAFIGCGYDHYNAQKRDVPESMSASTTTLSSLPEAVATAIADTPKAEKIVDSALNDIKNKEKEVKKIMDIKDIDFSKLEKPQVVSVVDKLKTIEASVVTASTKAV